MSFVHYVAVDTLSNAVLKQLQNTKAVDRSGRAVAALKSEIARAVIMSDGSPYPVEIPALPHYVVCEWAGERGFAHIVKVIAGGSDVEEMNRRCAAAAGNYGATALPMPIHDPATCMDPDCIAARSGEDEGMQAARAYDMDRADRAGFGRF